MATKTMAIIEAGGYRSPGGRDVRIGAGVRDAVAGTRLYLPGEAIAAQPRQVAGGPVTEVTNETSLAAARRMGPDAACLVFASAKNPGGGFLTGAQAQEESIARSSALHPCQVAAGEFCPRPPQARSAWGCGVFRNDPAVVAGAFAGQLARVQGHFEHVVFAVLDHQHGAPTHAAFARTSRLPAAR
jgi:hypothetical protein